MRTNYKAVLMFLVVAKTNITSDSNPAKSFKSSKE